jgi:tetratricopeptide (TPR) repeat protein/O-antigen ligase
LQTRLGYYADKVIEWGWLACAVFAPLFFNVYSSRVFEPDKITTIRSIVLIMVVAWLVKLGESGWRGASQSQAVTRPGKVAAAADSVVETAGPSWLSFLRVPVVIAIVVYALVYLLSTLFTLTPQASIFGSYQREQGFYSQLSYMMLGILLITNLRSRAQVNRLINFMLMASLPVALYGLLQAVKLDPLPWAGDTSSRVASSMGNAIFVAAWLIMVVPFAIYRLAIGLSGALAARSAALNGENGSSGSTDSAIRLRPSSDQSAIRLRPSSSESAIGASAIPAPPRRGRQVVVPNFSWAVVANCLGVIMSSLMLFFLALRMMAGLPYPDARTWWVLPVALVYFCFSVGAIEWLGQRRDDPRQTAVFLPIVGTLLFFVTFVALTVTWSLSNDPTTGDIVMKIGFDGAGLLWALFFFLLWCSVSASVYALSGREREGGYSNENRGILRASLNVGYALLILIDVGCIYLTQSRGPWLGLGAGLVVFMVGMWLLGRSRGVRWMARLGGIASALVLAVSIFVGALNLPSSPLQALNNLPLLGRGIERLSTLTRTEDGTGRVRELIWGGATQLILSDPVRALIGWGPESMYVAYNRFYPPQLGQVELRNATPDRSHNVEFDQMVTMGVIGLLAYYFLVGTFFFFGLRLLKRARNTADRLFALAIIAALASHFIEIQTGIQIASTWSYFYLILGMMVAFGYYITGYLRSPEAVPVDAQTGHTGLDGNGSTHLAAEDAAESPLALSQTRPVTAAVGAAGRAGATASTTIISNGKTVSSAQLPRTKSKASQPVQQSQGRGSTSGGGRGDSSQAHRRTDTGGNYQPDGRRRQSSQQYAQARGNASLEWFRNPILLVLYGAALIVALFVVFTVNSASVEADTLFKQAQAYDGANPPRYFSLSPTYPGSLSFYQNAISLEPNEDYYYLFEGRSWLEAAKQVDTESCPSGNGQTVPCNQRLQQQWSTDATQAAREKQDEKLYRLQQAQQILTEAHQLSPLNTDHYANLGRLYLYWADPSGGNDPSKAPLAVQWMQQATQHTPGNAQLWDELAVAYSRDNQFQAGMDAINHSQHDVDSTYANTPYIKGELLRERAATIQNELNAGATLPSDGETDWGKLVLEAGQAYSDTIALDSGQFLDTQAKDRITFLLSASQPFTKSNTTLAPDVLHNILTNTVGLAFRNQITNWEGQLSTFVNAHGIAVQSGAQVPDTTLQTLIANPAWADAAGQTWLDSSLQTITTDAAQAHYGLGLIYQAEGDKAKATAEYNRALLLKPTYSDPNTALQTLK